MNADIRPGPDGVWDLYGIVYNVGDVPVTLYGLNGPGGEDGYIYAILDAGPVEIFSIPIEPGNALDLMAEGLFLRFDELADSPGEVIPVTFYFEELEMPVQVEVHH